MVKNIFKSIATLNVGVYVFWCVASATHFFDLGDVILMEKPSSQQFIKVFFTLQKMVNTIQRMQDDLDYILTSKKRIDFELGTLKEYIEQVEKHTEDCK